MSACCALATEGNGRWRRGWGEGMMREVIASALSAMIAGGE